MADDATMEAEAPKQSVEAPKRDDKAKATKAGGKDSKGKANKAGGKDNKAKGKGKGSKKDGQGGAGDAQGSGLSIAGHPRAVHRVAQAKGWGGLIGFVLGGYLSLPTNTLADAGLHALAAGAACYVVVWAGAVFLWRHLVVAELRSRQHELLQAELERIGERTRTGVVS
jgi:hypothetical protein